MQPIGQTLDEIEATRKVAYPVPEAGGMTYRECMALRADRLKPAYNESVSRMRAAEAERDYAIDALENATVNLLLDEASETDVLAVEGALDDAERNVRRWKAATRQLDAERGVIRDSSGNVLR